MEQSFGGRLKGYRQTKGLTQQALTALRSLINPEQVFSSMMNGQGWGELRGLLLGAGLVTLALTGLCQWAVLRWSKGRMDWSWRWRLERAPLSPAKLLPLGIPALTAAFWLAYGKEAAVLPPWAYRHQTALFWALLALGLPCAWSSSPAGAAGGCWFRPWGCAPCVPFSPSGRVRWVLAVGDGNLYPVR